MFNDNMQEKPPAQQKTVHIILNGHPQKLFTHRYSKTLTRNQIQTLSEKFIGGRFKAARFFSIEGVQIFEEELAYARNGSRIYVSRGQDFDGTRNFGQYQLLKPLGEGGFGRVWLARSSIDQSLAAIKILKLQKITGARDIDMVFRQVQTLKTLSHSNIVKILNCYALANMQLVVVMEYLAGGELLHLVKEKGKMDQRSARKVFMQIVEAVSHCHRQGIIHRDLKLQNVLLQDKEQLKVKVADFGISGVADTLNPDVDVGTLRYMAPQVLNRKEKSNTAAVDVWALGVILFCMVYGRLPFAEPTSAATTQAIIAGRYVFPQKLLVSVQCQDLITTLLTLDPKTRPSIYEVQSHPWVLGIVSVQYVMEDRILENESPELRKSSLQRQQKRTLDFRKKLPAIPKRLQRQKEQVIEQLRNLRGSRGRLQQSQSKWRVGSPPRYMQNIRCKQQQNRGIKRRSSFITGQWK